MMFFNLYQNLYKYWRAIVVTMLLMRPLSVFAEEFTTNQRSFFYNFTDNIAFEIIYGGGWYSIGIFAALSLISLFSKSFREFFLSFILALFGIFLVAIIYEAYKDFEWIEEAID